MWTDHREREAAEVAYQVDWLMHVVEPHVLTYVLGGAASVAQVPDLFPDG